MSAAAVEALLGACLALAVFLLFLGVMMVVMGCVEMLRGGRHGKLGWAGGDDGGVAGVRADLRGGDVDREPDLEVVGDPVEVVKPAVPAKVIPIMRGRGKYSGRR